MMRFVGAALTFSWIVAQPLRGHAQGVGATVNDLKAAARAGAYLEKVLEVKMGCDKYVKALAGSGEGLTIDEREKQIREAETCLYEMRDASASYAPSTLERLAINELYEPSIATIKAAQNEVSTAKEFHGVKFGVGFGFSIGDSKAIDDAEIVNGVVRVKSSKREQPRVVFEFHKFMWCGAGTLSKTGCGPFVAVASADDKVVSGVGLGFMYGWRGTTESPNAFSLGIGAILDSKVKNLADGFVANKAPPAGETVPRFEEKSRWSLIVFATRTF